MKWTDEQLRAMATLGLDPENPRHRDLLAKFIEQARARPASRGRPKGTSYWDDAMLAMLAQAIDYEKKQYSHPMSDEQQLSPVIIAVRRLAGGTALIVSGDYPREQEALELMRRDDPYKFLEKNTQPRHVSVGTMRNLIVRGREILRRRGKLHD
jgi:hypothetical protein